jgi:O-antigen/teichoic acid export membrane protein
MQTGLSKQKIARGVAWASSAQWGAQLLGFGIYTALARLLTPQVFGLVAIAGIYIAFMQVFVYQGFGMALVQRHQLEREHLDSAFWIATATASLFCILTLLLGPQIVRIFHEPRVAPVIDWLSLSLLFYALSSVHGALLSRELDFRPLAVRSLIATGLGGAVGISMAYLGWGVWSLVGQQLANSFLGCVFMWWAVPWRPKFCVSKRHLSDLYGYSLSVTGNDILWFFCQKSDQSFVGYGFGSLGLGPYSLASRVVTLLHDAVIGPVQSVAFPAFSKLQSDARGLERALHKFCEMSAFICLPAYAGIIVVAPELVHCLFGSKWTAAIPILQVLAVYGCLRVLLGFMHPLMLAQGRPGLYLFMGIVLAGLTLVGCAVAVRWSTVAIGVSMAATMFCFWLLTLAVFKRELKTRIGPLLKSFGFPLVCSAAMGAAVALVRVSVDKALFPAATLALCITVGVVSYVSLALYAKPTLMKEILEMARHSLFAAKSPNGVEDSSPRGPDRTVEGTIESPESFKTAAET